MALAAVVRRNAPAHQISILLFSVVVRRMLHRFPMKINCVAIKVTPFEFRMWENRVTCNIFMHSVFRLELRHENQRRVFGIRTRAHIRMHAVVGRPIIQFNHVH